MPVAPSSNWAPAVLPSNSYVHDSRLAAIGCQQHKRLPLRRCLAHALNYPKGRRPGRTELTTQGRHECALACTGAPSQARARQRVDAPARTGVLLTGKWRSLAGCGVGTQSVLHAVCLGALPVYDTNPQAMPFEPSVSYLARQWSELGVHTLYAHLFVVAAESVMWATFWIRCIRAPSA